MKYYTQFVTILALDIELPHNAEDAAEMLKDEVERVLTLGTENHETPVEVVSVVLLKATQRPESS